MSLQIDLQEVSKWYPKAERPALDGISFTIGSGDFFGILGPNGAGKSTTIGILTGLLRPTSGAIEISENGRHINHQRVKHFMGFVPQEIALFQTLSARENLQYFGSMYGLTGKVLQNRIKECLTAFGLENHGDRQVKHFSGGMMRRVNLAAAVLHNPKLLFLDEPTVGVDIHSRVAIKNFLISLQNQGTTIVYTSHLLEEAETLCNQLVIIDSGHVIVGGSPQTLINQHHAANLEQLFIKLTGHQLRDA